MQWVWFSSLFLVSSPDGREEMEKWKCKVCGYIYDPENGDPDGDIPPGTPFDKLPDTWVCPVCGAPKDMFEKAWCNVSFRGISRQSDPISTRRVFLHLFRKENFCRVYLSSFRIILIRFPWREKNVMADGCPYFQMTFPRSISRRSCPAVPLPWFL